LLCSHAKAKQRSSRSSERGNFSARCLTGQLVRTITATILEDSTVMRIDKAAMILLLHKEPTFAALFMSHLLSRNMQTEEALVDQLFNSSEKRLARILLLLAHFGDEQQAVEPTIPKISQKTLADMVGTYTITRQLLSQQVQKVRLHRVQRRHAHPQLSSQYRPARLIHMTHTRLTR
jgi:CRP/FNR family cyclic AMP-dependent transcriptional regulator